MTYYETWSIIGQWVSGLGTIIVSIVLGIITYKISKKQEVLSKQNLKIELYKQRYDIYNRLENILRGVISGNDTTKDESLDDLIEIRDEVLFLFDKEIHDYLLIIINKFENLNPYYYGKERDDKYFELINWFMTQFADKKELREKFRRYLDLSNYGISKH